jgi:hypothetical protein
LTGFSKSLSKTSRVSGQAQLSFETYTGIGGKLSLIRVKKITTPLVLFCIFLARPAVFAQDQQMVRVYIAPMEDGSPEEQQYFMSNMSMEFAGAAYDVVDTLEDSDYHVILSVSRNEPEPEPDEDAETGGEAPAREENADPPGSSISLTLFDTKSEREIITLSWDYKQLSEMDMWNLYLITQAMANAPITKIPAGAAAGLAAGGQDTGSNLQNKLLWLGLEASLGYVYPSDGPYFSGAFTAEYDFLPFIGVGAGFRYQVSFPTILDSDNDNYFHGTQHNFFVPVLFKFLFRAGNNLIAPYLGAEFDFGNLGLLSNRHVDDPSEIRYIPAALGGVDFRLTAGLGAIDLGIRGTYAFDISVWSVGFAIGYKFGLLNRAKKD